MKTLIATLALLCCTAAFAATKGKAPVAKLTNAQRIALAVKFASTKGAFSSDPGAIFTGWSAGASKLPVVAKTGAVRVSSGDEQSPQFSNYYVTFGKTNKPNKLVFINTYE
jgi:hypothetical protein